MRRDGMMADGMARRGPLVALLCLLMACAPLVGCDDSPPEVDPADDVGPGGAGGQGAEGGSGGIGGDGGGGGGIGGEGGGGSGGDGGTGGDGGSTGPIFESRKSNLRFKRTDRIQLEFARILELPVDQLCAELGRYDCLDRIHRVTLGGVEPYNANIYDAFESTSISAPLIVERVALAACGRRVDLDGANLAEAVIWRDVPLTLDLRVRDIEDPAVTAALERLFTRAFLRPPSDEDLAELRQLYRDIEASGESAAPARDWGILACMITLTSVESLFY